MEPESVMHDKLGREIRPGCYIAYGHALGRCAGLRIGKVLAISFKPPGRYSYQKEPMPRISVWGVDDDHTWDDSKPVLLSKKSTLFFPDRVVVLDAVPEFYQSLLDSAA